jgi:hypothetical protein
LTSTDALITGGDDYFCWNNNWWGKNDDARIYTPSLPTEVTDYSSFYIDVDFSKAPMPPSEWMLQVATYPNVTLTGIDLYVMKK